MFLVAFASTCIYFEDFWNFTKIQYFPHSLYKILKGSEISQWPIPPNTTWILKLPSNIWVIIALYSPIVQVVGMFTLRMTRVESNFWEKWKIFEQSEEYESKTDWHKNRIFWTRESWFISTDLFGPIQVKCVNATAR